MSQESREQRLQAILHAYLQAVDRGESPDRQALLDAHPELRESLAEFLADASKLEAMAKSLKTATFGAGNSGGQPVAPSPAELAPHFPQLEILELLGQGGMGAVYKARQKVLDRVVALKILPASTHKDGSFGERFTREARALAKLNHPNIVAVYDFGQTPDGLFFFLMEYIDGVNLRQAMRAGSITPREALAIVPQICEALQFAHDEGIVHRDIKPENVLLDKKGRVKIADFGLAKLMGHETTDSLTGTHQVMGTLRYMAPEQMEGSKTVDHRADIYSLGVVFYELLTGELPMGRFAPPSKKVQIDVRLDEVVLRALEKEPEQRWQQASAVKTEMELIGASVIDDPVSKRDPDPRPLEGGVRARLAIFGLLMALAVGLFLSPWNDRYSMNHGLWFTPNSKAYKYLTLSADVIDKGSLAVEPESWNVSVKIHHDDSIVDHFRIQLPGAVMRWKVKATGHETNQRLTNDWILRDWMKKEAGLDVANPEIDAEIKELFGVLHEWSATEPTTWQSFDVSARQGLKQHYRFYIYTSGHRYHAGFFPAWALCGVLAILAVLFVQSLLRLSRLSTTSSLPRAPKPSIPVSPEARQALTRQLMFLAAMLGLYGSSFFQNAFKHTVGSNTGDVFTADRFYSGWECFRLAWDHNELCWYANPAFWIGVLLFAKRAWPLALAAGAFTLFLNLSVMTRYPLSQFHRGYWWWVASSLTLSGAAALEWYRVASEKCENTSPWLLFGERWRTLPRIVQLMVNVPLTLVYLVCLISFFGASLSSSTGQGREPKPSFYFNIGFPGPWFTFRSDGSGFSSGFHLVTWSVLAACIGLGVLWLLRQLERFERGKVHSRWWHYGVWIFVLACDIGLGVFSAYTHRTHSTNLAKVVDAAKKQDEKPAFVPKQPVQNAAARLALEAFLQAIVDRQFEAAIAHISDEFKKVSRTYNDHPNAFDPVQNGLKRWLEGPLVTGDELPRFTSYRIDKEEPVEGSLSFTGVLEAKRHLGQFSVLVKQEPTEGRWRVDFMAYKLALKPDAFPFHDGAETIAAYAKRAGLPAAESVDLGNGVKLDLVLIPSGTFSMGASPNEEKDLADYQVDTSWELPRRTVTIARPFYMGKYEVTQSQWLAVMGKAPKYRLSLEAEKDAKKFGNFPVEDVTLDESHDFCKLASTNSKRTIRLPSEAEWEYACRAGTTSYFYFGNEPQKKIRDGLFDFVLKEHLQYGAKGPYEVGTRKPNPWGLYDLLGNVAERVADLAHFNYQDAPTDGSAWLTGGDSSLSVVRGGCFEDAGPVHCRSAARVNFPSVNLHSNTIGLRVVMELPSPNKKP